mmetsp:Transcript_34045/g.107346  ORF Transcript_34045/g.107346 Transcript_34045/m.107346 type:complete len:338 (-) Transcript_34045:50-1063(-)
MKSAEDGIVDLALQLKHLRLGVRGGVVVLREHGAALAEAGLRERLPKLPHLRLHELDALREDVVFHEHGLLLGRSEITQFLRRATIVFHIEGNVIELRRSRAAHAEQRHARRRSVAGRCLRIELLAEHVDADDAGLVVEVVRVDVRLVHAQHEVRAGVVEVDRLKLAALIAALLVVAEREVAQALPDNVAQRRRFARRLRRRRAHEQLHLGGDAVLVAEVLQLPQPYRHVRAGVRVRHGARDRRRRRGGGGPGAPLRVQRQKGNHNLLREGREACARPAHGIRRMVVKLRRRVGPILAANMDHDEAQLPHGARGGGGSPPRHALRIILRGRVRVRVR